MSFVLWLKCTITTIICILQTVLYLKFNKHKNLFFCCCVPIAEQKTKKKSNKNGATTTSKRPSTATTANNANANATASAAAAAAAAAVTSNGIINGIGGKTSTVITNNSSDEIQKTQNRKKAAQQPQSQPKANATAGPGVQVTTASVAATVSDNGTNAIRIVTSSKPAKKVNKTSEMLETISNATVNTKLDEVLKTVRQLDNTCDFGRCRTKTSLIGQDCTLCQQRFCMKHQLPEIHGCGGAIKKEQRTEFLKPRPTLPAALRRNEQKDAHARLEQKLKEMSLARQKVRK